MQHTLKEFKKRVRRAKREIKEDIAKGVLPPGVNRFHQLYNHVDANEYGGLTTSEFDASHHMEDAGAIQSAIDVWLWKRGLE